MFQTTVRLHPPLVFWACLWGIGASVPLVAMAVDLFYPTETRLLGRDFSVFWAAGRLAASGSFAAAYDPEAITQTLSALGTIHIPFVYPPTALLILLPFGLLSYQVALAAWTVFGVALFCYAAKPHAPFHPVLAALTPAALLNIWGGQFGLVFGGLWLLAFHPSVRPAVLGTIAAVMTFKPHLAAMLVPRLIASPRAALVAGGVAAAIFAVTLPLWAPFIAAVRIHSTFVGETMEGAFFLSMMPGAYASFGRNWPVHFLFATAAVVLLLRYRRIECFSLATAGFIILPYTHNYDMTVASLGFAIFLYRGWPAHGPAGRAICALAFLSPAMTFVAPWAVPPLLLAALWLQLAKPMPAASPRSANLEPSAKAR